MSWKPGNLFQFKSLSLVTKLMIFYSLSTIGILASITLFLYPTFLKIIEQINQNQASYITTECYEKIIIILLFSTLSAIILGHMIARNGLKRLREFENKMEQITINSLQARINLKEWPKELISLGEKFNSMLDRIQSSLNQILQFSSDIAHELRTPLNNLRGITEIQLSKNECDEKQRNLLEKYMSEFLHLSKLIENLLFIARSDNRQVTLNKEIIDARKEILNICDYHMAVADEKKIEINCEGKAYVIADLTLFKRVISNLITNALKYTSPNGRIKIKILQMDRHVEIAIHDTGVGISAEHLKNIFDRFYRIDSSRSSNSGGIGLGLAIVKSILELHGGKIWAESKINCGTSMYLHFPSSVSS